MFSSAPLDCFQPELLGVTLSSIVRCFQRNVLTLPFHKPDQRDATSKNMKIWTITAVCEISHKTPRARSSSISGAVYPLFISSGLWLRPVEFMVFCFQRTFTKEVGAEQIRAIGFKILVVPAKFEIWNFCPFYPFLKFFLRVLNFWNICFSV